MPYFDEVILRDYSEDDARVAIFVVFNRVLAPAYSKMVKRQVNVAEGQLDAQRLDVLKDLLAKTLANGPKLLEVEFCFFDYSKEESEDFDETYQPQDLPAGAFLFFELLRKKVEKKGTTTAPAMTRQPTLVLPGT